MNEVEESNNRIVFMTTLERQMFPTKMPYNRFGNEMLPMTGAPNRGPGCYDYEAKTNFVHKLDAQVLSKKGYTLGARTGPRFLKAFATKTPCPTEYQQNNSEQKSFSPALKPFLVGRDRFPISHSEIYEVFPGPGTYEHEVPRNRQVQWHQAFGGHPVMMPPISNKSTIDRNTDKLYSTKEEKKFHRKLAYLKLYYD